MLVVDVVVNVVDIKVDLIGGIAVLVSSVLGLQVGR